MITEDYCSYEIAKLLKEKRFDSPCMGRYSVRSKEFHLDCTKMCNNGGLFECAAPSHAMAMKWLREVYNIFIEFYLPSHSEHEDTIYHGTYSFDIFNLNTKAYVYCTWNEQEFNSYEEAVEAALKYCLENLI